MPTLTFPHFLGIGDALANDYKVVCNYGSSYKVSKSGSKPNIFGNANPSKM